MPFKDAASVMIVRPAAEGFQVAMLERSSKLPFLGGFWVFAGGRLDEGETPLACAVRSKATGRWSERAEGSCASAAG